MENRPSGPQRKVSGTGKNIQRRGSGLGTGPVGSQGGYSGRPNTSSPRPQSPGTPPVRPHRPANRPDYRNNPHSGSAPVRGRSGGLIKIIAIAAVLIIGGKFGIGSLLGGNGGGDNIQNQPYIQQGNAGQQGSIGQQSGIGSIVGSLLGGGSFGTVNTSSVSTGWDRTANTGRLNSSVASGAREKRTQIYGGGKDTVTVMVYMCGTDLESKGGMASSDLQEMTEAKIGKNVNVLVYTGGCTDWQNNIVSDSTNQIYKVESGGLRCLVKNDGNAAMTKPETLTGFIKYCDENYPANRRELIFWDHGGGSISGYGYDEKNKTSGSMTLPKMDRALSEAGVTFDFIGFDACLMATLETALTVEPYADYLIASEETEPGIGWYYTNWLTELSENTSMPTLDIGKRIADDFVSECNTKCRGQKTTLSVTDLAELVSTVPEKLGGFSLDAVELLQSDGYRQVSDARGAAREFAPNNKIDQVDLVHLATKLGTDNSEALAKALLGAVKYNRTSSGMTNAYGLSIYFPYQKVSTVKSAVSTYEDIGMDSEYSKCIQKFASMEIGGQAVTGGSASPMGTLLGTPAQSSAASLGAGGISQLLGSLLGGDMLGVAGLGGGAGDFLGSFLDADRDSLYLADNMFDSSRLVWENYGGTPVMYLDDRQWSLIHKLELNVFFDDGTGFIDMGLDNYFSFDDDGGLIGVYDNSWLAVDGQPVAYYFTDSVIEGDRFTVTGRIPVMLNGDRAELIVVFDNDSPDGYIAGARTDYRGGETETVAKSMTELREGDRIDFLCDYYSYGGEYQDSYCLGEALYYTDDTELSYVYIDADAACAAYRFTDVYNQQYWSPVMENER